MAVRGVKPLFTENFSSNLSDIQAFLGGDGSRAFDRLFENLIDNIVPMLRRFPRSGRSFLERSIRSNEAVAMVQKLKEKLKEGDDLREFIAGDYLILYVVREKRIVFLSIRHHRQLTFDLKRFWQE
ncbi:MAG: type II toxin-antitoxin system RelE/ParE family toxin [Vicinamibacteria bacterium]